MANLEPDETMLAVSQNIKRLKSERGMTSAEIARVLKVSHSTVSLWEHAKRMPRGGQIQNLADLFGVPKSAIYLPLDEQRSLPKVVHNYVDLGWDAEWAEPLLKVQSSLYLENKRKLQEYAEFLAFQQGLVKDEHGNWHKKTEDFK
jgi:transcriptional regulator with XRE-family HTH domain